MITIPGSIIRVASVASTFALLIASSSSGQIAFARDSGVVAANTIAPESIPVAPEALPSEPDTPAQKKPGLRTATDPSRPAVAAAGKKPPPQSDVKKSPESDTTSVQPANAGASENRTSRAVPEKIPEPPVEIRIATWGGAYGEAQQRAVFTPFSRGSGIAIRAIRHTGGTSLLKSGGAASTGWDLANIPYHVAVEACSKGTVFAIAPADIRDPVGNTVDPADFLPDSISRCAIGTSVWSSLIGYDRTQFTGAMPKKLDDFFDTVRFPGNRGLPAGPRYTLEMALMADGVAPARVYTLLESDVGIARAFAKLETIRDQIVWLQSAREPVRLLMDHKVSMAAGFSGRFFTETAARGTPVDLLWDGQIYDMDVWVVPRGTTHMPTAMKFISFAVRPDVMARQAALLPYGPTRRSAARQVRKHASLPIELAAFLPTASDNLGRALHADEAWWGKNSVRLMERFQKWRDGRKNGAPAE